MSRKVEWSVVVDVSDEVLTSISKVADWISQTELYDPEVIGRLVLCTHSSVYPDKWIYDDAMEQVPAGQSQNGVVTDQIISRCGLFLGSMTAVPSGGRWLGAEDFSIELMISTFSAICMSPKALK